MCLDSYPITLVLFAHETSDKTNLKYTFFFGTTLVNYIHEVEEPESRAWNYTVNPKGEKTVIAVQKFYTE